MRDLQDVTYCGLYCRLCSNKSRVPQLATALRDTLRNDGWENYGEYAMPDFKAFWEALNKFARFEEECPDCRGGCGDPGCKIRQCAQERGEELCPLCAEFPCEHVKGLAARYPNLIADGRRLKEIGVVAWVREQEARRKTGFCYCDIRIP